MTYAWADNLNQDVDFIAQELRNTGLTVKMDRWNIGAGKRLWEQIADFIENPKASDGWMILATDNSLSSEACKEELAYALDRAIGQRGDEYPLIALFLGPVNEALVPASIRARLHVSLVDPDWKERIVAAVERRAPRIVPGRIEPYFLVVHEVDGERAHAIEVRPRAGVWTPTFAAVPLSEKKTVDPAIQIGPHDLPNPSGALWNYVEGDSADGSWWIMRADNPTTPTTSCYVFCRALPTKLAFGDPVHGTRYEHILR
ncbi:MAG: toll/interleukin-1 receptor domain-containing protein [Phycisphaerae bacterium]|nr:toll/interleukin-1 receptor domain-containing protein [Phycisphaerae bacterium]